LQLLQASAPEASPNVPALQLEHTDEPVLLWYVPEGQLVHSVVLPDENLPFSQLKHFPSDLYEPAPHSSAAQTLCPVCLYTPFILGQSEHALVPPAETVPAAQLTQLVAALSEEYLPAAQPAHCVPPVVAL